MAQEAKLQDYKVADMGLADFGRREIQLAEKEMPALMGLRRKYKDAKPLAGARIMGCIHMSPGRGRRWRSSTGASSRPSSRTAGPGTPT